MIISTLVEISPLAGEKRGKKEKNTMKIKIKENDGLIMTKYINPKNINKYKKKYNELEIMDNPHLDKLKAIRRIKKYNGKEIQKEKKKEKRPMEKSKRKMVLSKEKLFPTGNGGIKMSETTNTLDLKQIKEMNKRNNKMDYLEWSRVINSLEKSIVDSQKSIAINSEFLKQAILAQSKLEPPKNKNEQ